MNDKTFLKINPEDSVVVCLKPLKQGTVIETNGITVTVSQDTPAGHKILIHDVRSGENIITIAALPPATGISSSAMPRAIFAVTRAMG